LRDLAHRRGRAMCLVPGEGLDSRLDTTIWLYQMQIAPPDFDRMFGALADATRRDIVRRAIVGEEGVAELAEHYPMSFAAVQKHIAILERAGMVTKERIGRRKVVRTNLERLRVARRLLDQYEELWRGRVARMTALVTDDSREQDRMTALVTDNTKEQDR
jgi:DNA-binding transcriptional ArsR family regulator